MPNIFDFFYITPSQACDPRRIKLMKTFFDYGGRGTKRIEHDKIFKLEANSGAVFLIVTKIHQVEFVLVWCRAAMIERWGCYSFGAFRRVSSVDLTRTWAEPVDSELMIYHAVSVYLVAEEPWMLACPPEVT